MSGIKARICIMKHGNADWNHREEQEESSWIL